MLRISPFLWFNTQAEDAMNFYVSIFPRSKAISVQRVGGKVLTVTFELEGQQIMGLNGGPQFTLNEAFSLFVSCETQAEVDELWTKLLAGGGTPSRCGWLRDKFGVSWQIVPTVLGRMLGDQDRQRADRVMAAMLQMGKLDVARLQQAYDGR